MANFESERSIKSRMAECEPIHAPQECGAEAVFNRLDSLQAELHDLLTRLTGKIANILVAESPETADNQSVRQAPNSTLFSQYFSMIENCRTMVSDYHSVIDRIDL